MSKTTQLIADSVVRTVESTDLTANSPNGKYFEELCSMLGVVYVTAITRDGCSGCTEQKPLYGELAAKLNAKHPGLLAFSNIHVQYSDKDVSQSLEAKKILRHAAYPTYVIQVRSTVGPLEVYRAIYPSMDELEKQIVEAMDLAEFYKGDAQNSKN